MNEAAQANMTTCVPPLPNVIPLVLHHARTHHDASRVDPHADLDAAPRRGVRDPGRGVQHALGELEELHRVLVALHQQTGGRLHAIVRL